MNGEAIPCWLRPLQGVLDPAGTVNWRQLESLAARLDSVLAAHPVGPDLPAGTERSGRLLAIRRDLAKPGYLDGPSPPGFMQLLAQFVCGYRDIDLRDSIGLGHGQLIARHAGPQARRRWVPRLLSGELAGIAITESHGGSRPASARTHAAPRPDGTWLVTGRKTWISRLTEAAVFLVFFRDPDGRLAAAAVDAAEPGLRREPIAPSGLAGWTWGRLDLNAVPVRPEDRLHGDGMTLLRHHFASYRPLVTATALGGAAAVFDTVTATLAGRQATGELPHLRDCALVTIGRAHAQLVTALLGAVAASHRAEVGDDRAEMWAGAMKAHGIDTANQAGAELALLLGATGYRADCQVAKTCRDLGGLLYADGIHDSLYRAAGKHHTASETAVPEPRSLPEPMPTNA